MTRITRRVIAALLVVGIVGGLLAQSLVPNVAARPLSLLSDNLVAYWTLNEASGTRADSVASNTLTDNNTVGNAAGKHSNAALFIGDDDEYLSIVDNPDLSVLPDTSFTFSAWIYPTASMGDAGLMSQWQSSGAGAYMLTSVGGAFRASVAGGQVDAASGYSINTWYHVVWGYDAATDQVFLYINNDGGVTAAAGSGSVDSGSPFWIGGYWNSDFTADARIDEVGFWEGRVLSAAERGYLYNAGAGCTYPLTSCDPTPTPTATSTNTPTPTATATATPTNTPTNTPTPPVFIVISATPIDSPTPTMQNYIRINDNAVGIVQHGFTWGEMVIIFLLVLQIVLISFAYMHWNRR